MEVLTIATSLTLADTVTFLADQQPQAHAELAAAHEAAASAAHRLARG